MTRSTLVVVLFAVALLAAAAQGSGTPEKTFYALEQDYVLNGPSGHNQFARDVYAIDDLNEDGLADMLVRQHGGNNREVGYAGPLLLYLSPIDEIGSYYDYDYAFRASRLDPNATAHIDFGRDVVVGDLNGDSHLDLVASSRLGLTAYVYVFYGPFTRGPDGGPRRQNITVADADVVIAADPLVEASRFGRALAVCDVDGTPGMDLVIGDPRVNGTATSSRDGAVYVYSGPLSMPELSAADASVVMFGTGEGDEFGISLVCKDVGGGPEPELLVSEPGQSNSVGALSILGDIHMGGTRWALFLGPTVTTTIIVPGSGENVTIEIPNAFANAFDVVNFNADAAPDVIVAAHQYPTLSDSAPDSVMAGEVYVFWGPFGPGSGTFTRADAGVIIRGSAKNEQLASGILGIPSINGDDIDDIVLTTQYFDRLRGQLFVIHGLNVSSSTPQIHMSSDDASSVTWGREFNDGFGYSVAYLGRISNKTQHGILVGSPLSPNGFSDGSLSIIEEVPTTCPLYSSCTSCANGGCTWCKGSGTCMYRSPVSFVGCPGRDITLESDQCPGTDIRDIFIFVGIASGVCFGFGLLASRFKRICCSEDEFQREERLRLQAKEEDDEEKRRAIMAQIDTVGIEDAMFDPINEPRTDFDSIGSMGSINAVGYGFDSTESVHVVSRSRLEDLVNVADVDPAGVGPADATAASSSHGPPRPTKTAEVIALDSTGSLSVLTTSSCNTTSDELAQPMTTWKKRRTNGVSDISVIIPADRSRSNSQGTPHLTPTPKLHSPKRHKMYTSGSEASSSTTTPVTSMAKLPTSFPPSPETSPEPSPSFIPSPEPSPSPSP